MNRLLLSARVQSRGALRHTPAGLPALDLVLAHESEAVQEGTPRKLGFELRALAIGTVTQRLQALALGSGGSFAGFLAGSRSGRGWLFHITEVEADATTDPNPTRS